MLGFELDPRVSQIIKGKIATLADDMNIIRFSSTHQKREIWSIKESHGKNNWDFKEERARTLLS